jgi:hypothetical protein
MTRDNATTAQHTTTLCIPKVVRWKTATASPKWQGRAKDDTTYCHGGMTKDDGIAVAVWQKTMQECLIFMSS